MYLFVQSLLAFNSPCVGGLVWLRLLRYHTVDLLHFYFIFRLITSYLMPYYMPYYMPLDMLQNALKRFVRWPARWPARLFARWFVLVLTELMLTFLAEYRSRRNRLEHINASLATTTMRPHFGSVKEQIACRSGDKSAVGGDHNPGSGVVHRQFAPLRHPITARPQQTPPCPLPAPRIFFA